MVRAFVLLFVLAGVVAADTPEVVTAQRFLALHKAKQPKKQHLLAMTAEVQWPLVVNWLMRNHEVEAARQLAAFRAGAPDGKGLARLVAAYVAPGERNYRAYAEARALLRDGRAADALAALKRAGPVQPATVFGAQISMRRGEALQRLGRKSDAYLAWGEAAKIARAIGWWQLVGNVEQKRIGVASSGTERLVASDGAVEAYKELGDTRGYIFALRARASIRLRRAGATKNPAARAKMLTEARRDYNTALVHAEPAEKARVLRNLAFIWQAYERPPRPRQALKTYEESLAILRKLPAAQRGDLPGVLYNAALVAAGSAQYDKAIALLDELLALDTRLRRRALQQRAYVLWRQRRLEKAAAAYDVAIAAAPPADLARLRLDACELHLQRGDPGRAMSYVQEAPRSARMLVTRGRVWSRLGEWGRARADFDAGLALEKDPVARVRYLLVKTAELRGWGDIDGASLAARAALVLVQDPKFPDFGNAAVTWLVNGDLALLRGERDGAEKMIGNAASIFLKMEDPYRAVPAYVQWTLLLVQLKRREPAVRRLDVMLKRAEATSSPALKSSAKCTEAIFEARAGRIDNAVKLLDEARALAQQANDRLREATALVNRALVQPGPDAVALVDAAHAALDARRTEGPEEHPLLEGHRPEYGSSIGVAALLAGKEPDVAAGFRLIQRARADRLLLAFRGRDALLAGKEYAAARGRLIEARAEKKGVAEAEKAFDAYVANLRATSPARADLAFPRPVDLRTVQGALRADEALLVMLADPYVPGAVVVVTNAAAALRVFDVKDPLAAVAKELAGKKNVIVAPDGQWALRPLATAPWKGGLACDAFAFYYVASTRAFVRGRAVRERNSGPVGRIGPGPARIAEVEDPNVRHALIHAGHEIFVDCRHPQGTRAMGVSVLRSAYPAATVVLPNVKVAFGPRAMGIGVLVEAHALRDVDTLILSLGGTPPAPLLDRFYAGVLDKGMPPARALHAAQAWFRGTKKWKKQTEWAGLVLFGVPR